MAFTTDPFAGFNPTVALTVSTTTPEYPKSPIAPGTQVQTDGNGMWLYVQVASGKSCTAGDVVIVTDHVLWQIDQLTSTTGKTKRGSILGVAGATATSLQYIWIQTSGYVASVNILATTAAFTALHSSATAGRLTSTAVGGTSVAVSGLSGLAVAGGGNTAACILSNIQVGADD